MIDLDLFGKFKNKVLEAEGNVGCGSGLSLESSKEGGGGDEKEESQNQRICELIFPCCLRSACAPACWTSKC